MRTILSYAALIGGTVISYKYYTRLRPVSEDEVIWSWLRSEMMYVNHQFSECYKQAEVKHGHPELLIPDLNDKEENVRRRNIFWECRGQYSLWDPIYKESKWYRRRMLILPGLMSPYYIHGAFKPNKYGTSRSDMNGIILWGHEESGPFIVLEGNHRWYDLNNDILPFIASVYIGLSDKTYPLHSTTGCDKCKDDI